MFFNTSNLKKLVARAALEYIDDGMIIGVGSGSTVREFINLLASSRFRVKCVPTSYDTELLLRSLGLHVLLLRDVEKIDVAVDGADSVLMEKQVIIKGGGGALLREKIVDYLADEFIVIVDESKVNRRFPVPIEILPFAYSKLLLRELSRFGVPSLRLAKNKLGPVITDNGNWIIDLDIPREKISRELETILNHIPGALENGVFTRTARILIANRDGRIEEKKI